MRTWWARPLARPGASLPLDTARVGGGQGLAHAGYSLVELMFVAGLIAVLSTVALPGLGHALDEYRTRSAARYVASRLQWARAEAVSRGANVALRFSSGPGIRVEAFVDGNRNGVSSADIAEGIDLPIAAPTDLADVAGAQFGIVPGVSSPEGGALVGDPIRFGAARMASFTPLGTVTAGSVYIRGRDGRQYAVRVYGDTGKTTTLRFDHRRDQWVPP